MSQHQWTKEQLEIINRYKDQLAGKAKREYPEGRMSHDDEGALAIAITADKKHGVVVIDFGKPVEWLGLEPQYIKGLVEILIKRANEIQPGTFS